MTCVTAATSVQRTDNVGWATGRPRHAPAKKTCSIYASNVITPPPIGSAEYCDERVCLCFCLSAIVSSKLHVRSSRFFVHVTYGRGSVLLWRRSDMLYTSGFTDYVTFAHKPRLLDVAAQPKNRAHAALGLAINCAQHTNGRTGLYFSGA